MKQESLDTALDVIFEALDKSNICLVDKLELMKNLKELLENYYTDIEILKEESKKRR